MQSNKREKQEFALAEEFLQWLNEERLLILAMIADAADEALILTRFLDDPSHEIANVPVACQTFLSRLHALFIKANDLILFLKYLATYER